MLPFILIMSMFCQGHAVDYGTDFVTAFPENLAFYFPAQLILKLKLTTFLPNTHITIFKNGSIINDQNISAPGVSVVNILDAEVNQLGDSGQTIRITSDKNITVLSYSKRGDSIQTNVVPPTTNLGMSYLVPSPNYTELAVQLNTYNTSVSTDSTIVPMDFSYRLLIINAEEVTNKVTVTKKTPTGDVTEDPIMLGPFAQTLLPSDDFWYEVTSTAKVAVILTNPCIDTQNCRCNLVAHQLRPSQFMGSEFIFPPYGATNSRLFVTSDSQVDLTSGSLTKSAAPGSIALLPFLPQQKDGTPVLTTSKPASVRVIYPGLIIELLPTSMFSSCYLVHTNSQVQLRALVIVEMAQKNKVYMGTDPLQVTKWTDISDPGYSWAEVDLTACKSCVIWHPTTQIAVYVFENSSTGVTFGGPAISVNDEPDPNGCVAVPVIYELSDTAMSWQAARSHCISKSMVLASPDTDYTQQKMAGVLNSMNVQGVAWLGLRRSLATSEWYWHSSVSFDYTKWNYNQPTTNLCVSVKMETGGNFTWSSMRCCSSMLPLCAREMVKLSTVDDSSTSMDVAL